MSRQCLAQWYRDMRTCARALSLTHPTVSMLAPDTIAPERLALVNIVPLKLHCPMLAFVKSAPVKSASVKSAPNSVTPARLLPTNFARFTLPLV